MTCRLFYAKNQEFAINVESIKPTSHFLHLSSITIKNLKILDITLKFCINDEQMGRIEGVKNMKYIKILLLVLSTMVILGTVCLMNFSAKSGEMAGAMNEKSQSLFMWGLGGASVAGYIIILLVKRRYEKMDVQNMVMEIVERIQTDPVTAASFTSNPTKTIRSILQVDISADIAEMLIIEVKEKLY